MEKAARHDSRSRENGNLVFAPLIAVNILDARFRGHDGLSLRRIVRVSTIPEGGAKGVAVRSLQTNFSAKDSSSESADSKTLAKDFLTTKVVKDTK